MKRPPFSPILEQSPHSRHRRALSEEERALWDSVARQVKPLRKNARGAGAQIVVQSTEKLPSLNRAGAAKPVAPAKTFAAKAARSDAPRLAPLGRRERSQLSRGRIQIDARLDLHGMTQMRAHHTLFAFLQRARSEGLTFVLVITGKGRGFGAESERGVLRRQVPHWLGLPEFRALVVGFEEAHLGHGGEGALYVRIRRAKT